MDYEQIELNLGTVSNSPTYNYLRSPQYDPYWDELLASEQSTCKTVGEQVTQTTEKFAHQPEYTHFVEKYWVEKKGEKYWYYRYAWMEGRKLKRKYIGSVNSPSKYKGTLMVKDVIVAD